MHTSSIDAPSGRRRRNHSAEFKASVIRACEQPGVSLAAVALANGLNATMVRKWVREAKAPVQTPRPIVPLAPSAAHGAAPSFIPLPVPAVPADIRIELQRSGMAINVTWPSSAAPECAAWLRELLR